MWADYWQNNSLERKDFFLKLKENNFFIQYFGSPMSLSLKWLCLYNRRFEISVHMQFWSVTIDGLSICTASFPENYYDFFRG